MSAKEKLGTFNMNRKIDETKNITEIIRTNPDKLSKKQLDTLAKGVKSGPLLNIEHSEKNIDATHADINMGRFFKKILVREIAEVPQWDAKKDVAEILEDSEHKRDVHLKRKIGKNPALMMPGNYARILINVKNEDYILELIRDEKGKDQMRNLLDKFRFMRKIYGAKKTKTDYPEEVAAYHYIAVMFGRILIDNFDYVRWSNYTHKIIEHVDEIIESDGSVGAYSSEGNESGNKLFRHFRKHHSRKSLILDGLEDIIKIHWLYCSKKLQGLATVVQKKYKCTKCGIEGHNKLTCDIRD